MKKTEFAVGEVFQFGLKKLRVVEGELCGNCAFCALCGICDDNKV